MKRPFDEYIGMQTLPVVQPDGAVQWAQVDHFNVSIVAPSADTLGLGLLRLTYAGNVMAELTLDENAATTLADQLVNLFLEGSGDE